MFFSGDLQSGIALALRESKCIVCFVRDAEEESRLWEDQYLTDSEVIDHLQTKAVTLHIEADSQEADYLAAVYPLSTIPTMVVINNGQLHAGLKAGLSQEDFKRALIQALISPLPTVPSVSTGNADNHSRSPQSSLNHTPEQPPNVMTSPELQDVFDERRRRLEADKEQKDAAELAERKTKAKAKRIELGTAEPDSARAKQATYAQLQKKRQQEARHERERILKVIENDKLERRQKEELRKALNRVQENGSDGAEGLVNKQIFNEVNQSSSKDSRQCAVQVRLFDGSTIRSRFSPARTLRVDIRSWVDHERTDGDNPYTFRQVLAPMPNRPISISEEEESLETLGLMPNATLIMVPVQAYTTAYGNGNGLVSRGFNAGYELVSGGVGLVTGALGSFLGLGQRAQPVAQDEREHQATADPSRVNLNRSAQAIKIRTLKDQQVNLDRQQFYNGNQLNFEPRDDEEKKE